MAIPLTEFAGPLSRQRPLLASQRAEEFDQSGALGDVHVQNCRDGGVVDPRHPYSFVDRRPGAPVGGQVQTSAEESRRFANSFGVMLSRFTSAHTCERAAMSNREFRAYACELASSSRPRLQVATDLDGPSGTYSSFHPSFSCGPVRPGGVRHGYAASTP